jgi:hypothetical protein
MSLTKVRLPNLLADCKVKALIGEGEYVVQQGNRTKSLLVLILSFDGEPFSSIQKEGQDMTFVRRAIENSRVLRYVGQSLEIAPRFKAIMLVRRFQYFLLSHSNCRPIQRVLTLVSGFGFVNQGIHDAIEDAKKNALTHTPQLQTRRDSPVGTIVTSTPEGWAFIGAKTLEAFSFVLQNYEFDFLFRTNSSSYVDTQRLLEYLDKQPETGVYSGVVGTVMGDLRFASGAGILMSKDVLKRVCEQADSWNHSLIDDAALGELIQGLRDPAIRLTPLDRLTIPTLKDAVHAEPGDIKNSYHIRCKSRVPAETKKIMHYVSFIKGDT